MEANLRFEFKPNTIYRRDELAHSLGITDRAVRIIVRKQRRAGVPIMALKQGGYKLAETEAEKRELINLYLNRALDELETLNRLRNAMQVPGQTRLEEFYANEGNIRY